MRALLVPVVLVALVVLGGCAEEPAPGPAGPATALTLPPSTPATAPTTDAAPAEPSRGGESPDVADCYDGNCEIAVTDDTEIPLDPSLDAERITVSDISGDRARVTISGSGGIGTSTSSGSSSLIVRNDLSVRTTVEDGVVELEIETS